MLRLSLILNSSVDNALWLCLSHTVAHPNLVRLLGYACKPELLIVQELCLGRSLDQQLYVEMWKPTATQVLQAALDVARGMAYLHTAFEDHDNFSKAVIHRDLKSPNLLLSVPPPPPGKPGSVVIKIGDLGLSRDKEIDEFKETVMMTGCGSILWMAPEIMLGKNYNEKVDQFSYAMCLLELCCLHLPVRAMRLKIDRFALLTRTVSVVHTTSGRVVDL